MENLSPESKILYEMLMMESTEEYERRFLEYKKARLDAVKRDAVKVFVDETTTQIKDLGSSIDFVRAHAGSELDSVKTALGSDLETIKVALSAVPELAALVPTNCSSECPRKDAYASVLVSISSSSTTTGSVVHELAAPEVSDRALDMDVKGDTAPTAAICVRQVKSEQREQLSYLVELYTRVTSLQRLRVPLVHHVRQKLQPPWPPPKLEVVDFHIKEAARGWIHRLEIVDRIEMHPLGELVSSPSPFTDNGTSSPCMSWFLDDLMWKPMNAETGCYDCALLDVGQAPNLLQFQLLPLMRSISCLCCWNSRVPMVYWFGSEFYQWEIAWALDWGCSASGHEPSFELQQWRLVWFFSHAFLQPKPPWSHLVPTSSTSELMSDLRTVFGSLHISDDSFELDMIGFAVRYMFCTRFNLEASFQAWVLSTSVGQTIQYGSLPRLPPCDMCLNLPTAATDSALVKYLHCKGPQDTDEFVCVVSRYLVVVVSTTRTEAGQLGASADMLQTHKFYSTRLSSWEGAVLVGQHWLLMRCNLSGCNSFEMELVLDGYCQTWNSSFFTRLLIHRAYELMPWTIPWSFSLPLYICSCHAIPVRLSTSTTLPAGKLCLLLGQYSSCNQFITRSATRPGSQFFEWKISWYITWLLVEPSGAHPNLGGNRVPMMHFTVKIMGLQPTIILCGGMLIQWSGVLLSTRASLYATLQNATQFLGADICSQNWQNCTKLQNSSCWNAWSLLLHIPVQLQLKLGGAMHSVSIPCHDHCLVHICRSSISVAVVPIGEREAHFTEPILLFDVLLPTHQVELQPTQVGVVNILYLHQVVLSDDLLYTILDWGTYENSIIELKKYLDPGGFEVQLSEMAFLIRFLVPCDPGDSMWCRLGVKPNFMEGGLSATLSH